MKIWQKGGPMPGAGSAAYADYREKVVRAVAVESSRRGDGRFADEDVLLELPEFTHAACGYAWESHERRGEARICPAENEARALYGDK